MKIVLYVKDILILRALAKSRKKCKPFYKYIPTWQCMKVETPLGFPISAFPVPQMIHGLSYFLQSGQQSWCFHIVKKRHGDLSHHPESDPHHLCHHSVGIIELTIH